MIGHLLGIGLTFLAAVSDDVSARSASADEMARFEAEKARTGDHPEKVVGLAVRSEARGLTADRQAHSKKAVAASPEHAARGMLGQVSHGGKGQTPEAVGQQVRGDATFAAKLSV